MLTMNRATVLGHAGRNPEMRTLPSGDEVALFSLATNERFRRRDGTEGESTEWHAIVAFGNAAQTVRKLVRRGAAVLVEGRIATRTWTDRAGTEHRTSEILVSGPQARVNVLTKRVREREGGHEPPGGAAAPGTAKPEEPGPADAIAAADTDAGTAGAPDGTGAEAPAADGSGEAGAPDTAAAEPGKAATPGAVIDAGGTHGAQGGTGRGGLRRCFRERRGRRRSGRHLRRERNGRRSSRRGAHRGGGRCRECRVRRLGRQRRPSRCSYRKRRSCGRPRGRRPCVGALRSSRRCSSWLCGPHRR